MSMRKLLKSVFIVLVTLAATLISSKVAFAAEAPRIENGVMYLDVSQNNDVIVYGLALEIEGIDIVDISPLINGRLIDVQVNGEVFKGISEIVMVKGKNSNSVILDKGSYIVTAPLSIAENVNDIKKALKETTIELATFQQTAVALDDKALTYRIGGKGQIETVEGNPIWMLEKAGVKVYSYETKMAEIAVKEQAETVSGESDDKEKGNSGSSSQGSNYRVNVFVFGRTDLVSDIAYSISGDTLTVTGNSSTEYEDYQIVVFDVYCADENDLPPDIASHIIKYDSIPSGSINYDIQMPDSGELTFVFSLI